jgi:hypothetical protein
VRAALLLLIAAPVIAQINWEFSDTLRAATDVLVGDIVAGAATDEGATVSVKTTVRVVRVLHGSTSPGTELSVSWQYRPSPSQPPSLTTKLSLVRALWFLKRDPAGRVEPLRAAYFMPSMGASYLPAATTSRPYSSAAPLHLKLAEELGSALEEIAVRNVADLLPRPLPPLNDYSVRPDWAQTRTKFQALTKALEELDRSATAAVYAHLSALPDPNLKAVGLGGRFGGGDLSALFDLERELAVVAPVFNIGGLALQHPPQGLDLPAAHAIGRMAVSETQLREVERDAPRLLTNTRRPEVLPYLIAMLGSPEPYIRDGVLFHMCTLFKGGPLWQPGMQAHCPRRSPVDDPEEEVRALRFWNDWWTNHRGAIARSVTLPIVSRPARYHASPFITTSKPQLKIESTFLSMAMMQHLQAGRTSGPRAPDIMAHQLDGNDLAVWRQALTAAGAMEEQNRKQVAEAYNAMRIAGNQDTTRLRALGEELRAAALKQLEELRGRMTLGGWLLVEKSLTDPSGVVMPPVR